MATTNYQPDPYQGWSVIGGGLGNVTAHQIMTDTSGQWQLVSVAGGVRTYAQWGRQ